MSTALDTALRLFETRTAEGDVRAADFIAETVAALLGADFRTRGVAPRVPSPELDAQIRCASSILAARRREGDASTTRRAAITLALLTAKRSQRAAA